MKGFIIIGVVSVVLLLLFACGIGGCMYISTQNRLIAQSEEVEAKWADIDSLLLSRNDKIPNLAAIASKGLAHETEIFKILADGRSRLASGGLSREDKMAISNEMSSAFSRLLVFSESNPQLKGDKQLTALMDEVAGMENRLARARGLYNEAVKKYNTLIRQWPGSMFGYEKKEFFQVPESAKQNVDLGKLLN